MSRLRWLIATLLLTVASLAGAHEMRPILMQLEDGGDGQVVALLKLPIFRDQGMAAAQPLFPTHCRVVDAQPTRQGAETIVKTWQLYCPDGLMGAKVGLQGFSVLAPDALLIARLSNGQEYSHVLTADRNTVVLAEADHAEQPIGSLSAYIWVGVVHILVGFDHLLFLLGLILVIQRAAASWRVLLATVTAFTLAHSLTLVASVLGAYSLPSATVETLIALSVLMLAAELARSQQDASRVAASLTFRRPWLVAFVFGLLHGFGFAGVLQEIGLPQQALAGALLLFNLGVELGQLAFVAAIALLAKLAVFALRTPATRLSPALTLLLGSVSAAWVLERLPAVFLPPVL